MQCGEIRFHMFKFQGLLGFPSATFARNSLLL
jgi:hypothetical protein